VFCVYNYQYSALGPVFGRNKSPARRPALALCILVKFLGVVCHSFPLPLYFPTFAARCLHVPINASAPSSERCNCGQECSGNFAEMTPFYAIYGSLTYHKSATWGKRLYFPFEGRHAEDFFSLKMRRLRPGANPRSWVPEASMLTKTTCAT
jgi:hypothetical protein